MTALLRATGAVTLSDLPTVDGEVIADDPDRRAWLDGMLAVLAHLEANPTIPLPYLFTSVPGRYDRALIVYAQNAQQMATATRGLARGGRVTKRVRDDGERMYVTREFGAIQLAVTVDRSQVCERVVVGTETVTEEVPDPNAPKVKRPVTREIVEWKCEPILAEALETAR